MLADLRELAPLRRTAQDAKPGLRPGACKGKAHRREYLGYAGRRAGLAQVVRQDLADHRADRKNWLMETLGLPATDPARYAWEPVAPGDHDHMPYRAAAAARRRRPHPLATSTRPGAKTRAGLPPGDLSATG